MLKISRRGVDTTARGESLVGDIVSDIEDGISRDGGLASGSGSMFRESAVSLIGRIRSKRKTRSSSINYYYSHMISMNVEWRYKQKWLWLGLGIVEKDGEEVER